jgi:hypothetical protein
VTEVGSKAVAEAADEDADDEPQIVDAEVVDAEANVEANVSESAGNHDESVSSEPEVPYQRSLFDDEDLQ